ncbi:MAG: hypothetical protein ABL973_20665 [Micropepsaceae bacterium]
MSDIKIEFTWYEILLFSPMLGWPGLISGGLIGAAIWRKRPIVGGIIGALVGNAAVFLVRLMYI